MLGDVEGVVTGDVVGDVVGVVDGVELSLVVGVVDRVVEHRKSLVTAVGQSSVMVMAIWDALAAKSAESTNDKTFRDSLEICRSSSFETSLSKPTETTGIPRAVRLAAALATEVGSSLELCPSVSSTISPKLSTLTPLIVIWRGSRPSMVCEADKSADAVKVSPKERWRELMSVVACAAESLIASEISV